MAVITLTDLPVCRALDVHAMTSLRGAGGAPWVFGVARPFTPPVESIVPSVNFYNVTNNFTFIDKVVNQFTTLNIDSGDNSPVTAVVINSLDS
jgi:hypothetical protein